MNKDELGGRKVFLLFSHPLTAEQKRELLESWNVSAIAPLPPHLQRLWSGVPPHLDTLASYLEPLLSWLEAEASPGDVAVIQGDFGAVYLAVNKAFELGVIPLYATTKREVRETNQPDGSIKQERVFCHVRFRVYGR